MCIEVIGSKATFEQARADTTVLFQCLLTWQCCKRPSWRCETVAAPVMWALHRRKLELKSQLRMWFGVGSAWWAHMVHPLAESQSLNISACLPRPTAFQGARASKDMPELLEIAAKGGVNLKSAVTRRFSLDQAICRIPSLGIFSWKSRARRQRPTSFSTMARSLDERSSKSADAVLAPVWHTKMQCAASAT